jgi:hypothetical protein
LYFNVEAGGRRNITTGIFGLTLWEPLHIICMANAGAPGYNYQSYIFSSLHDTTPSCRDICCSDWNVSNKCLKDRDTLVPSPRRMPKLLAHKHDKRK